MLRKSKTPGKSANANNENNAADNVADNELSLPNSISSFPLSIMSAAVNAYEEEYIAREQSLTGEFHRCAENHPGYHNSLAKYGLKAGPACYVQLDGTHRILPMVEYFKPSSPEDSPHRWTFRMAFDGIRSTADAELAVKRVMARHAGINRALHALEDVFGGKEGDDLDAIESLLLPEHRCIYDQTGAVIYFSHPSVELFKRNGRLCYGGPAFDLKVEDVACHKVAQNLAIWQERHGIDHISIAEALNSAQLGAINSEGHGVWTQQATLTLGHQQLRAEIRGIAGELGVVVKGLRWVVPLAQTTSPVPLLCGAPIKSLYRFNEHSFQVDKVIFHLMTSHGFVPKQTAASATAVSDTTGIFAGAEVAV